MFLFSFILCLSLLNGCTSSQDIRVDTLSFGNETLVISFGNETLVISFNSYFKKEVIPEEEGPIVSYILPNPASFWVTSNSMAEFDIDSFPSLRGKETSVFTFKQGLVEDRCWWIIHIKNSRIRLYFESFSVLNGGECPIESCSLYEGDVLISSILISSVLDGFQGCTSNE